MLAKILGLKKTSGKSSEELRREKNASARDEVSAGGDGERYNYPVNLAYPFHDEKATSIPAPLAVDVSVLTDGQKSAAANPMEVKEKESQDVEKKPQKKKKQAKKVDEEEEDEQQKDKEKDEAKETCSPEACNKFLAQKSLLDGDVIPTKLTEMISTSIKEAVQTIVKQCSMVPKKQETEKPVSKDKHAPDIKRKVCDKDRRDEKIRDRKQRHRSRSRKRRDKSKESHPLPSRHKRSSSEKKSGDSKKTLEERSKKLEKLEKNLKADNRRMTGNVNIYICSEATENTQVNGKKKDTAEPCAESSSETATEKTGTCSQRDSSSSSKLMERIEKRRKKLQKEREHLNCLCEEVSSRNASEASSSLSSWRTEYKNSRPTAGRAANDPRNVQESSSGDIAGINSFSTSSTRDGCLCNDTNVSGTDMVNDSDVSLPRSRFTACDRNLYDSGVYPVKSQVSSIESDRWEPTTICTNDHRKERWTENVGEDRECRCVDPRVSSFEGSGLKRNMYERKRRRHSDKYRKENWSTCSCIREEDEEHVGKVCKIPSEKLTVCKTVEQASPKEIIPCPAFVNDSPKETTVCSNRVSEPKTKQQEQTVCTNVVRPKETARDSKDVEEKDALGKDEQGDTSRQTSVDESPKEDLKEEKYPMSSKELSPRIIPREVAQSKKSATRFGALAGKEVDRSESKKTLDEEKKKECFLTRLVRILFKGKGGKEKIEEKEVEQPKDEVDSSKIDIAVDDKKKIEGAEAVPKRPRTTGVRKMENVRSAYTLDKGGRPKTKLELILESRKAVGFAPKRSMVFRRAAGEAKKQETDNNGSFAPRRKVPLSPDTGNDLRKTRTKQGSANQRAGTASPNLKTGGNVRAGDDSARSSVAKSSLLADEKDSGESTAKKSPVESSKRKHRLQKKPAEIAEESTDADQQQTRKDAISDAEKMGKDTTDYVPCEGKKPEEKETVCRCKQPDPEDRDSTHCCKCKKPTRHCCCEKEEKKKEVCCECTCSSKPEQKRGPCCKRDEPVVCDKCCGSRKDCKCKKIFVCADCCKPVEDCCCRCRKPKPPAKCFKASEICCCEKVLFCVYCGNPRDYCTCRAPVQKCSYCGLPSDVCNCKNPETCSLLGREVLNDKDNERMIRVTGWRPRKDVRRYFSRTAEDECRCHEKPKPYGCEELPYQRLSVFSNVMNELQQKISESVCCTRCRRVPCCCCPVEDERKDAKPKCRVLDNCRCGGIGEKNLERAPPLRVCCVCNTSPCRCKKGKSSQRKPRAKCYYCKSSPCTCVAARENNKARPCRCSVSPYRGKEEEARHRAKPPAGAKNDGKLFCVRGSKISICPASRKQRHHENSGNAVRRRREDCTK